MAAIVEQVTVTKLVDIPAFAVYDGTGIPMIDEAMAAFDGAPLPEDLPAQMLDHCADNMKRLGTERELKEFLTTGKSNRRPMCYARMVIPAGRMFGIHCHPNVEIIHIVRGCLVEDRLKGRATFFGPFAEGKAAEYGLDLADKTPDDFVTKRWGPGEALGANLSNEIGSVHRSYCPADQGCELFVLWGGCHASVAKPPTYMSGPS